VDSRRGSREHRRADRLLLDDVDLDGDGAATGPQDDGVEFDVANRVDVAHVEGHHRRRHPVRRDGPAAHRSRQDVHCGRDDTEGQHVAPVGPSSSESAAGHAVVDHLDVEHQVAQHVDTRRVRRLTRYRTRVPVADHAVMVGRRHRPAAA